MDKLKSKIRTNKRFTIFLFVLVILGMIAGSLFITILSSSDKSLVKEYLTNYMNKIKTDQWNFASVFFNSIGNGVLTSCAIWMLGISVVGIPVILFLFFCKIFTLGFSIGSIFYVYKWKGIGLAFCYVLPQQIIQLFAYGMLVTYALSLSIKMIEAVCKKKTMDFKAIMSKYSLVLGFALFLFILASLLETFLMPSLMKWVLSLMK